MRFQEPRLLVERAGEGGEEVRCITSPASSVASIATRTELASLA